jgi:predicted nucleic acid-binding protein
MTILLDTNVLGRLVNPADALHRIAIESIAVARQRGYRPAIVPQVVYKFWVVATRPLVQNGVGMSVLEAENDLAQCFEMFDLFRDERAIFDNWHELVVQHEVKGKQAHDARLAAAMKRHGIRYLLTFNDVDFRRYEGITVVNPQALESLPSAR